MQINYYINGQEVNRPLNYKELSIELNFDKERYEFYIMHNSRDCSVKIWDMREKEYVKFPKSVRSWRQYEVWKYGFKPLKKAILLLRGFKEKRKLTQFI